MKKDLAKNIRYILENFDSLDFSQQDLSKLQETLNFLKIEVQQEIIARELEGNEEIRNELLTTLEALRKRKEELEKEKAKEEENLEFKYPEFEPIEKDDEILSALQEQVEQKRKNKYETEKGKAQKEHSQLIPGIEAKIKEIESKIQTLEELEAEIETPDSFIAKFLEKEGTDLAQRKQKLIDICATNMGTQRYSNGEVYMPFFKDVALFDCSSNGYIINPEAVEGFLEIARDEELAKEISEFSEAKYKTNRAERKMDESQGRYDFVSKRKRDFDENPELVNEIAQRIIEMTELVKNVQTNSTNMPVAYNPVSKFFNSILRKRKVKNANLSYEKFVEKFEEISSRIREDTKFASVYDSFRNSAKDEYTNPLFTDSPNSPDYIPYDDPYAINSKNKGVYETLLSFGMDSEKAIEFCRLYIWAKDKTAQELISQVGEKLDRLQSIIGEGLQSDKEIYKKQRASEEKVIRSLSPRALEKAKSGADVSIAKYIDLSYGVSKNRVSPYVASLMLEALVKSADVKTTEDAEKVGLVVTEEEIEAARQKASQCAPTVMEYAKKVKEKVEGTRDDDSR